MYNKIILVGNLTRDIEIRYSNSNLTIGSTGLAVSRKFKSQTGEQKEEVLFVDVTFFGRTAEIANQYMRKGSKVLVEGRLKLDQWTDQSGVKRSKHSVTVDTMQMLDKRQEGTELREQSRQSTQPDNPQVTSETLENGFIGTEEDFPF